MKIIQIYEPYGGDIGMISDENNPTYPGDYLWESSRDGYWYQPVDHLGDGPEINPGWLYETTIFRYTRYLDYTQGHILVYFPEEIRSNQTIRRGEWISELHDVGMSLNLPGVYIQYQWEKRAWNEKEWQEISGATESYHYPRLHEYNDWEYTTTLYRRKMIINWQDMLYSKSVAVKIIPELGEVTFNIAII